MKKRPDIIVAGGGPAALALALAAKRAGGTVLRIGNEFAPAGRHYALGLRARRFLKNIGAEIPAAAVVNRFWLFSGGRKAEVGAAESGLDSLCHVVCESDLLESLRSGAGEIPNIPAGPDAISEARSDADAAAVRVNGNWIRASLIAAADGARSRIAALAGVGVYARAFGNDGQAALSTILRAPLPADVAAQWFARGDILALLPAVETNGSGGTVGSDGTGGGGGGTGGSFSLIWSLPQAEARRLAAAGPEALAAAVSRRTGMAEVSAAAGEGTADGVALFPLTAIRRAVRVSGRIVFAGDGARTIHPLAGQGLNLGLRDAEDLVGRASRFADWGDASALSSHAASRVLRAEALHRATAFFAECGDGASAGILTAANCFRPLLRASARFANGY